MICSDCGIDFESRRNKPGKINQCEDCGEENVTKRTGVMIYGGKNGAEIQINSDPELTKYMIEKTKLRNKGSNLGSNLKVSSKHHKLENAVVHVVSGVENRRHGDST
jgi:hypothetical protein